MQVAPVEKTTIQHTINTQAILFPAAAGRDRAQDQRAGAEVSGEARQCRCAQENLLAVLENRDLSAAAQETKGTYEQAQASYETTTAAQPAGRNPESRGRCAAGPASARCAGESLPEPPATLRSGRAAAKGTRPVARGCDHSPQPVRDRQEASGRAHGDRQATGTQVRSRAIGIGQGKVSWERRRNSAIPRFAARSTASSLTVHFTRAKWRRRALPC